MNYPAYKKELLGVIFACKKFHYYIWGRKFTLFTDHRPLTFLKHQKDLPQIIEAWKETLFTYDFDCIYRPGLLNIIPDTLSRAFPDVLWKQNVHDTTATIEINAITRAGFRKLTQFDHMLKDKEFTESDSRKMANHLDNFMEKEFPEYMNQDVDTESLQIPNNKIRQELLRETHAFGPLGANAMVKPFISKDTNGQKQCS
jgi:hypothetical protein